MSMSLAQVLAMPACSGADTPIRGLQLDSRKVVPGDLFLAMPGELHDGRQFIEQAVASGAAAVAAEPPVEGFVDALSVPLVEVPDLRDETGFIAARFYRQPGAQLHMVGITGTNGKTTVSRLAAQLFRACGSACGVIGTLGASLAEDVAQGGNTTPDAVSLQALLAEWRDAGIPAVCMEVSSHALVQGRVNGVPYHTAVFTNLSHDHLDYHGDMESYGRAKLSLFTVEGLRRAVLNLDDPFTRRILQVIDPAVEVITYSMRDPAADVFVERAEFSTLGVRGVLRTPWGSGAFSAPLHGDFNLLNLAAAVSAAVLAGLSLESVLAATSGLAAAPGRMQSLPNSLGLRVIVDYAHTPDALEQVLQSLRPHVSGALVVVFGCGGDRDRQKRQIMGRVACQLADRVVLTSDNPRGEEPLAIIADIETGCSGDYAVEADRSGAIHRAIAEASSGDCVVIAGKGHENYQIIGAERLPFSDKAVALQALQGRART
ncbi:UDP-N-acetylmuramoyl-L-alanyl-D-glutamate--2,6-diaminopimelate ligase [Haliea sp. E17]|uniref:UDP-N-acetylmuramoyl-L-alanyl-D-glutamate--2, 6-diaminopimelate ligase n=1 Tax=Haliea sp. E17 TaxID=3401576 RepID=UPI003AAD666C